MLRCPEGSHDRSTGQTPSPDTDPNKKTRGSERRPDSAPRTFEIQKTTGDPSAAQKRYARDSCTILAGGSPPSLRGFSAFSEFKSKSDTSPASRSIKATY